MPITEMDQAVKDSKFMVAVARCVKTSINTNIKLGMHLLNQYAVDPNTNKMKLISIVKECLTSFLQDGAVNFNNDNILHILVKASNTFAVDDVEFEADGNSETKEEINKLINLICGQYGKFNLKNQKNKLGKKPSDLANDDDSIYWDVNICGIEKSWLYSEPCVPIKTAIEILEDMETNSKFPALPSVKAAILSAPAEQNLIAIIHENLSIFLRDDAITLEGHDILSILTSITG
ncbi:MAG: hypothetical protein ACK4PR_08345, partial [Gammaproteobacteria bacterium]